MLFDLGRIDRVPAADLLKVRYVFVSHTHMDHFIGFDHLLRLFLARDCTVELFGPAGVIDNVQGKLRGYTWNLVDGYPFILRVHEVGRQRVRTACLRATTAFQIEWEPEVPFTGVIATASGFQVRAAHLDHRIDSLGYAVEEDMHLNVRTDVLAELAIPPGPWLNALKAAVRRGDADDARIVAEWRHDGQMQRRELSVGELRRRLLTETPGQKLAYVTDVLFSADNVARVVDLVRGADLFYCESLMLDGDRDQALKRYHLTARQAGTLARLAAVKRLHTFHFSPRYDGEAERLREEAGAVFSGRLPPDEPV
jgi:ribonuclease Z